ncbi:MAG: FxLYD domain-containing protein [Cyanobacteriota bacterium]|nr:FxLYD domain-containing protein [Cyanobacteriota bacterium]
MKYFYFTILIPLLHGGVDGQLLQSHKVNIFAQKSEFDNPICYMETTEGKIINLVNLCGDRDINEAKKVSCKSESEKVKPTEIPISNVNYDGNFLTGKVANESCQTVKQIKVNYQVLDDTGNIIDNGFIYAEPSTVEPGKVASFKGNVTPGAKVETTFVEWSE